MTFLVVICTAHAEEDPAQRAARAAAAGAEAAAFAQQASRSALKMLQEGRLLGLGQALNREHSGQTTHTGQDCRNIPRCSTRRCHGQVRHANVAAWTSDIRARCMSGLRPYCFCENAKVRGTSATATGQCCQHECPAEDGSIFFGKLMHGGLGKVKTWI